MMRPVEIERRTVGHGGRDGDNLLVLVGQLHQRLGKDLGVSPLPHRLGVARLRIVWSKPVKLLYLLERRLEAASLLRQNVQQNRHLLALKELERPNQQLEVVAIQRTVVVEAKLLEQHRRPQQALRCLLGFPYNFRGSFAAEAFDQSARSRMQVGVVLVGHHLVQVVGDSANIAIDRPLVVVEHNDQPLRLSADVVQRLKRDAVGERGIARHGDNVLARAGQIARHRHAQRGRKRRARMTCAVGIVLPIPCAA